MQEVSAGSLCRKSCRKYLLPLQRRYAELAADPAEVDRILALGAARAAERAAPTLQRAKHHAGLLGS